MALVQFDFLIIGAGISGLNLSKNLIFFNPNFKIIIIEKSKSCGGRMATRRVGNSKYDHGAQFITKTDASESLINFWKKEEVLETLQIENKELFYGVSGMTQLSKKLAENSNIFYNYRAIQLKKTISAWECLMENKDSIFAKNIILSSPLPQSLEILNSSMIKIDSSLLKIEYSKGIVILVEFDTEIKTKIIYEEKINDHIFSICSQQEKKLSTKNEYVIVMSDTWSEQNFELSDEEIINKSLKEIISVFGSLKFVNVQIKKWRYSFPLNVWSSDFYSPENGLYLCGDAFGGKDLNGAIKSSDALFKNFIG